MRHSELWGFCFALAFVTFATTQVSAAPPTVLVGNVRDLALESNYLNPVDFPIEQDRGIQLVHHHGRPRHAHYGGFYGGYGGGGCYKGRPVRYSSFYLNVGVPHCSHHWGTYSNTYYRPYYGGYGGWGGGGYGGGYGGGCRIW